MRINGRLPARCNEQRNDGFKQLFNCRDLFKMVESKASKLALPTKAFLQCQPEFSSQRNIYMLHWTFILQLCMLYFNVMKCAF